jgi:flap endonuclease-1
MGTNLRELVEAQPVGLAELRGKVLAVDSFNLLYQFLTTVRQADGGLLTDSKGNVTSHLTGLFSRLSALLMAGARPAFVFDGKAPDLKRAEQKRRSDRKIEAQQSYEVAKEREDITDMKKYASRTAHLTPEILASAQRLIALFGCPIIQAPSEGEAQAAYIVRKGQAYATVSQDFDSLLYATPRLIRNLSLSGRRRQGLGSVEAKPEIIDLAETLKKRGITGDQLIVLAILVGTDYHPGIKGIGPKKALTLVKKHGLAFDALFEDAKWDESTISWKTVFALFSEMPVTDDYSLHWAPVDRPGIIRFLCDEHDFSRERIVSGLEGFSRQQKGLSDFF